MLVDSAIELFLDHRRHRSPGTRLQYRRWLTHWRAWCRCHERPNDLALVDIADIRDYLKYLETEHVPYSTGTQRPPMQRRGLMPASVVAARRTLRALWIFLNNEELLTDRQARFFGNNRIPTPEIVEQPRPYCDPATLEALLEACGDGLDETSARNRAILLLLYESGMRIGELCALKDDYVDLRGRQAKVLGKGNRWRPVFWLPIGSVALIRYVFMRRGPRTGGPLFRGTSTRNNGGAMSTCAVRAAIKRIAREAGIVLPEMCPVHGSAIASPSAFLRRAWISRRSASFSATAVQKRPSATCGICQFDCG